MQDEYNEIRKLADLPLLLDLEMADKVFSHKSLFAKPAHVHVEEDEPQDYERCAKRRCFAPKPMILNLTMTQGMLFSVTKY